MKESRMMEFTMKTILVSIKDISNQLKIENNCLEDMTEHRHI